MAELEKVRPEFSKRLEEVGKQLEWGGHHLAFPSSTVQPSKPEIKRAANHLKQLGEEWEKLIEEVYQLPGFENFF